MSASIADSFKLVLNSTDGRPLCAVNQPDNVFTFDGSNQIWNSTPSCLPDSVQCSWMCRKNSGCTAFNYRSDSRRCEFFTGSPKVCTVDTQCTLFRVSRIYFECSASSFNDALAPSGLYISSQMKSIVDTFVYSDVTKKLIKIHL